ncbi:MAG TPA: CpsB/CapC family capsule biosynthesis tyrosine phosphatase [Bacteroidia bacterium]|jgi:tyrosine-protein phosphatase YwqE|nr:CpsB/CapC family capsule biosynthesis tyrosine phosphatase [Bacteroidia bacterium]
MGIFSIFKRSAPGEPVDLSVIGIDMHSHFIPGIDDGAKTMKDSIELLRSMEELGYKKAITTPHIMSDFFRNTPEIISTGLEQVQQAARKEGLTIQIEAAAEYYFDYELEGKVEKEKLLTFGNNYFLFEVSYMNPPDNLEAFIFKLITTGYKPVLAHPERYPFWFSKSLEKFEKLKDKGVLFQLNINSLTGHYSLESKRVAEQMIDNGWYEFIGTDCHHMGHVQLLKKARGEKALKKLIESGNLRNSSL